MSGLAGTSVPGDSVEVVEVVVDRDVPEGPLGRPWTSIGYDEINWTYTPSGRALLGALGELADAPYLVRCHYLFCSGTGLGLPHWGAGNVYHERSDGSAYYDFQLVDQVFDAIVGAGHVPIVELGFTPLSLVPPDAARRFAFTPGSPTQYSAYEAGLWSFPPSDLGRWRQLVVATVGHCISRYGLEQVESWWFECWNEPDISYWRGTVEEYLELYRTTAEAVRSACPRAKVGGPATTGDLAGPGPGFLGRFLDFCVEEEVPLDFVSFHTKGAHFDPWRSYLPQGSLDVPKQSPSTAKMLREIARGLSEMSSRPSLSSLPCLVDECDASVPAHRGRFDNPNFCYRNTEYYPVFQCNLMRKLLDLEATTGVRIVAATAWAFYFEGERFFEGTRSFTTQGVDKPVLNAYRLLARLGDCRVQATSDAASTVARLIGQGSDREEVDVLAASSPDGTVTALVWRHDDDQHREAAGQRPVRVRFQGLGDGAFRIRHWRVDDLHGNAHRGWLAMGQPDYPDEGQRDELRRQAALEPFEAERLERTTDGRLEVLLGLPLPSVSLLQLVPG